MAIVSDASCPVSLGLVSAHAVLTLIPVSPPTPPHPAQVHAGSSGLGDACPGRPEGPRMADIR